MSYGRPDLRLDAPTLEPSDDLVHRLAAAARTSHVTVAASRRRHRVVVAVAAFLGISAVSVGGAWAVGAIEVPGLPSSPLREAAVTPDPPAPQDENGGAPGGAPGGGADSGDTGGTGSGPVAPASPDAPAGRETGAPVRDDEPGRVPGEPAADAPAKDEGKGKDKDPRPGPGQGKGQEKDRGQGESRSRDKGENAQQLGRDKERKDRGNGGASGEQDRQSGRESDAAAKNPAPAEPRVARPGAGDE